MLTHIHRSNFLYAIKQVASRLGHTALHFLIGDDPSSMEAEDSTVAVCAPCRADLLWSTLTGLCRKAEGAAHVPWGWEATDIVKDSGKLLG